MRSTWVVTGATGAIGRYVLDELLARELGSVTVLARTPSCLPLSTTRDPRVTVLASDASSWPSVIASLGHVRGAILAAAAWGVETGAREVNVDATVELARALLRTGTQRLVWFGTASILDEDGRGLAAARRVGTAYIASKAECRERLLELWPAGLTAVHPTIVMSGAPDRPWSHAARLIGAVGRYAWLARSVAPQGTMHVVHGTDLARVAVDALVSTPPAKSDEVIVGAAPCTATEVLDHVLRRLRKPRLAALPLSPRTLARLARVLRIELSEWDRYCMERQHFVYPTARLAYAAGTLTLYPTARSIIEAVPLGELHRDARALRRQIETPPRPVAGRHATPE
ncbi:MAG: NAD(P)-dependent oxidoreductase [Gemmatimonadaceae bacterium]